MKKTGKKNIWLLICVPLQCLEGDSWPLRGAVLSPKKHPQTNPLCSKIRGFAALGMLHLPVKEWRDMELWKSPMKLGGGIGLIISGLNCTKFCTYFNILLSKRDHHWQTISSLLWYVLEMMLVFFPSLDWWKVNVFHMPPQLYMRLSSCFREKEGNRVLNCWRRCIFFSLHISIKKKENPLLSHDWICSALDFYDMNLSCALQLYVSVCIAISGLFL